MAACAWNVDADASAPGPWSLGYEPHNMTWYDMGEGLELRVVSLWVRVYRFWGESYSNRGPNPKP